MSRFYSDVKKAVESGKLKEPFTNDDVRKACPGWANDTYESFFAKHRKGNKGGFTEYFIRHSYGVYILIKEK